MRLTLGFSPCPNDTFIFDALIHGKIDTEGLSFDVRYEDVETLNQQAFRGELDITKLSYHAYAYAVDQYVLLDAGSALGFGVGPLLICKDPGLVKRLAGGQGGLEDRLPSTDPGSEGPSSDPAGLKALRVGIPGKFTTANFLLGLAYPGLTNKQIMVFSKIEDALLAGEIDLGLIIHENRFTYKARGLHKIVDLGDYWEQTTGKPIPLGGIVARRSLPAETKQKINRVLRRSVQFAFDHPDSGIEFIRHHAQEMEDSVIYQHIELYVNQFSLDLGPAGKEAIRQLYDKARSLNLIPDGTTRSLFLD